jgi:hypothetical protein
MWVRLMAAALALVIVGLVAAGLLTAVFGG